MASYSGEQMSKPLKGHTIVVPGTSSILYGWPSACNSNYERLKELIDHDLDAFHFDDKKIQKLKAADFALFGSCWWPDAGVERVHLAVTLIIWLFIWDDELDQATGSLLSDLERANEYREKTIEFVDQCLGYDQEHGLVSSDLSPLISSFEVVGKEMREKCSSAQLRRLRDEIMIYIKSTEPEQLVKLRGETSTLKQYWRNRLGTSAVGVTCAMIEYTTQTTIPTSIMRSKEMRVIWHETNMIISMVNDLLSARKELSVGSYESYLPLACAHGPTPQAAVDKAVRDIKQRAAKFDKAAARLLSKSLPSPTDEHQTGRRRHVHRRRPFRMTPASAKHRRASPKDRETHRALEAFLRTARQNCVGNMDWSLVTPRYGLAQCERDEDGGIIIQL